MKAIVSSAMLLTVVCGNTGGAMAQVVSDNTVGTTVNQAGAVFNINNGMRSGNNLFHSFSEFSVPTGGSAIFNNATTVQNIFSRVTGSQVSTIDGILRTQGSANLFLMNPNGIVFGPNATLNLGGSFVGTTANSIKFADGIEFNTVNTTPALLSINLPIGLQMGQASGSITVQGTGHRMTSSVFSPLDRSQNPIGLQVGVGNTLALIGNEMNFSGGIASVNGGGHVEVGSVSNGLVKLNSTVTGWVGDYASVQQFNDIHLAQQSLLDASGSDGSIQVQGRNISLSEGSSLLLQNLGSQPSGDITVHGTESVNFTGTIPNGRVGSLIRIQNLGMGPSGNINISAAQLSVQNGGFISNETFSPALGGSVTVNVSGTITIDGFAPANPIHNSSIGATTFSSANAGNTTLSTGSLRLLKGGSIGAVTFGSGQTGALRVNAQNLIEIAGNNSLTLSPSSLTTSTIGSGNANSLFVNTSRLVLQDGGFLGSSTLSAGASGRVTVNASDSIEIRGRAAGSITASRIASTAEIVDPATQAAFGLPAIPSGDAGSVTLNTPSLRITDGALISVRNDGPGKAGDLQVTGRSVFLDQQGSITASTASGNGGNIRLTLPEALIMRHGSLISATALGNGNGGNLTINSPIIVGLENSDIIANAAKGNGGNIKITTQGIFGLKYRDRLTPNNDITASSEFGINGNVQVNTIGINPANALNTLPVDVVDSSRQIADRCGAAKASSFIATGRGGIPQGPTKKKGSDRTWHDLRLSQSSNSSVIQPVAVANPAEPIVEASAIQIDASGTIVLGTGSANALVAAKPIGVQISATCGMGESH